MKRFSPADPAQFKPLFTPDYNRGPQPWRCTVALAALPPPDKATRVLAGLVAFTVLL